VATRRTLLQSVVAIAGSPLAPGVIYAGGVGVAAQMGVLYDHRHREARVFRLRAAQLNAPIHGTPDGDITDLWQHYFSVAWKDEPMPLAGLTERPALFMLEQLGFEHGMRVLFQAEHEPDGQGGWSHTVVRSSRPGLKGHLEAAGSGWPAVLADQLLTAPQTVVSKDVTPTGAAMAASIDEPARLRSWIIAPRSVVNHI
jgi:hypothetical protein